MTITEQWRKLVAESAPKPGGKWPPRVVEIICWLTEERGKSAGEIAVILGLRRDQVCGIRWKNGAAPDSTVVGLRARRAEEAAR